jgi:CubicO group peptidase (beta-lactamase class C family)
MAKAQTSVAREQKIDEKLLSEYGIDPQRYSRIHKRIEEDIAANLYPGAAIAVARKGVLLNSAEFGHARIQSERGAAVPADPETLWLMYSQTKPILASAVWLLAERGIISFHEPVCSYIPEFAKHGKSAVTVYHLLTHQSGFPNAGVPEEAWENHEKLKEAICDFPLEWQPGERVFYHGISAHWVLAALIRELSGKDFRRFVHDEVIVPLGLKNLYIGANESILHRTTENYERSSDGEHLFNAFFNSPQFLRSGMPGAGGFAAASDIAMFYQMLLGGGELNGKRVLSPRMVQYATRNHTGDRNDDFFGMPMHRALGVHVRGTTPTIRGLGSTASPSTFGHGGVGTSYSLADPETGISFTYLSNSRISEPFHSRRLEEIIGLMHASVVKL